MSDGHYSLQSCWTPHVPSVVLSCTVGTFGVCGPSIFVCPNAILCGVFAAAHSACHLAAAGGLVVPVLLALEAPDGLWNVLTSLVCSENPQVYLSWDWSDESCFYLEGVFPCPLLAAFGCFYEGFPGEKLGGYGLRDVADDGPCFFGGRALFL